MQERDLSDVMPSARPAGMSWRGTLTVGGACGDGVVALRHAGHFVGETFVVWAFCGVGILSCGQLLGGGHFSGEGIAMALPVARPLGGELQILRIALNACQRDSAAPFARAPSWWRLVRARATVFACHPLRQWAMMSGSGDERLVRRSCAVEAVLPLHLGVLTSARLAIFIVFSSMFAFCNARARVFSVQPHLGRAGRAGCCC